MLEMSVMVIVLLYDLFDQTQQSPTRSRVE